jgi:hypothetical protein
VIKDHAFNWIGRGIAPYAKGVSLTRFNTCSTVSRKISIAGPRTKVLYKHIIRLNNNAPVSNLDTGIGSRLSKHRNVRVLDRDLGQQIDISTYLEHTGAGPTRR